MMHIAMLAGANTIHAVRWANAWAERGHCLHLISQHVGSEPLHAGVERHRLPFAAPHGYFLNVPWLRRLLNRLQPDLLNVHYASGYGTLGRLSGFHPLVLSVWGDDVYTFPEGSRWHRMGLVGNLRGADLICSTSRAMAGRVLELCPERRERVAITPFGVDLDQFSKEADRPCSRPWTVGTVKSLEHGYGIDLLIRAFALARQTLLLAQRIRPSAATITSLPTVPRMDSGNVMTAGGREGLGAEGMRLLLVGDGSQRSELVGLIHALGLDGCTEWTGAVPHQEVSRYLRAMDIYVALSRRESFGVAVVEASACGLPVVVSNAGGLPEVVEDGVTGYIVALESPETVIVQEAADHLVQLLVDEERRHGMGQAGRLRVERHFSWPENVSRMEGMLLDLLSEKWP